MLIAITTKTTTSNQSLANTNLINPLDNKAAALGKLGNYTGALTFADKALAIDPNDKLAIDNKALGGGS